MLKCDKLMEENEEMKSKLYNKNENLQKNN